MGTGTSIAVAWIYMVDHVRNISGYRNVYALYVSGNLAWAFSVAPSGGQAEERVHDQAALLDCVWRGCIGDSTLVADCHPSVY
ncbi:hypothetical protein D3C73_982240 [compost metagenome]